MTERRFIRALGLRDVVLMNSEHHPRLPDAARGLIRPVDRGVEPEILEPLTNQHRATEHTKTHRVFQATDGTDCTDHDGVRAT